MPLDSQLDAQESKSSHASRAATGELKANASPRKKRRRRKKHVDAGIPTWRIVLAAALSVIVIGATIYRIYATIEEERLAPIKAAHEREVQLQAYVAEFLVKALAVPNDLTAADLKDSVDNIISTEYRLPFNKLYGDRAPELIEEGTQLLADFASASATYDSLNGQVGDLRYEIDLEEKALKEVRSKVGHKSFLVLRQFDITSSGQGVFEALDASYRRCALIADTDEVSPGDGHRITLAIKSIGNVPVVVTRGNAYNQYDTTEYFPTYEASEEAKEIIDRVEAMNVKRRRVKELLPLVAAADARLPGLKERFIGYAKQLQAINEPVPVAPHKR